MLMNNRIPLEFGGSPAVEDFSSDSIFPHKESDYLIHVDESRAEEAVNAINGIEGLSAKKNVDLSY